MFPSNHYLSVQTIFDKDTLNSFLFGSFVWFLCPQLVVLEDQTFQKNIFFYSAASYSHTKRN